MKGENIMENIKSIYNFETSYQLLSETFGVDVFDDLSEDERNFLECVDDFESVTFYVVNDDTVIVCDSMSGDVSGNPVPLEEFKRNLFNMAREEAHA